jgi:hypothetical protein
MAAFAKELRACLAEVEGQPAPAPADDLDLTLVTAPPSARAPARAPARRATRRRRRPTALYVLLALLVAGAAFAAVLLLGGAGRDGGGSGGGSGGSAVKLRGLSGYDPQGTGGEHDELAGSATDGSQATAWTTETYGSQDFGGLKTGVGLTLAAGGPVKLAQLTVKTPTPGFTAEIEASDSPTGGFTADSSSQAVNGTTTFTLNGRTAAYYVVWITQLPPTGGKAEISEVTATS